MNKWMGCVLGLIVAGSAVADDWSAWRGPNANGISSETGLNPKSANKLWTKELGAGYSSVSVKGDKLYTMGNIEGEDIVYCLAAETGTELWTYSYPCEQGQYKGPRATPVVDGENLYTVSRDGLVICLEATTGKKKWETDTLAKTGNENIRWGVSTSAVIHEDLVLLVIGEAGVALDKFTGKLKWKSGGSHGYASPVLFERAEKTLAAIFSAPGLVIVNADSGEEIDRFEWKTKYDINGADPMLIEDKIFISSAYKRGGALFDFSSGKLVKLWENDAMRNQFSSGVYIDGHIYGADGHVKGKGHLRCLDVKDGSETWSHRTGFASVIAADGKLIVLDEKGGLYFLEAQSDAYKEIAIFETGLSRLCWTPPTLANGVVYCRNDKGTLVAVDVSK